MKGYRSNRGDGSVAAVLTVVLIVVLILFLLARI